MNNLQALEAREASGVLNDSIAVGAHIMGMPFHLSTGTDVGVVKEWMKWHDE